MKIVVWASEAAPENRARDQEMQLKLEGMLEQDARLPELLAEGYGDTLFVATMQDVLDWVPELKHEGLVCTHLSSALRKRGASSRREVTLGSRRFDMQINGVNLEAKYHHEGDLHEVLASFTNRYVYDPRHFNSATKAIHQELGRGPSWFLWIVCVRDAADTVQAVFPHLIKRFYKATQSPDYAAALAAAERLMSTEVSAAFNTRVPCTMYPLPTIKAAHAALISRLYFVHPAS